MKNNSTQGILYPLEFTALPKSPNFVSLPKIVTVPRMSWNYIEKDLVQIFTNISNCNPTNIFIFSSLRNGKIGFDDEFTIYTDSDCELNFPILTKNDDVCSEEFSAEILTPFIDKYYPTAKVNQFLAPEKNENNAIFFNELIKNYKSALFVISKNGSEDSVWPENLPD